MIEDFLWWVAEKSWLNSLCLSDCLSVFLSVCLSVQAFWHLEPELVAGSGPVRHHSARQNYGNSMVLIMERLVPPGTYHVPPREPLQKNLMMRMQTKPADGYGSNFVGRWWTKSGAGGDPSD